MTFNKTTTTFVCAHLTLSYVICGMFLVSYAVLSTVDTSECSYSNGRHYCYGAKHCCAKEKFVETIASVILVPYPATVRRANIAVTENVLRIVPLVPIVSNAL